MALVKRKLEVIDWSQPKKTVCGYLLRTELVRFNDGGTGMKYLVRTKLGAFVSFKGATQLDMMLQRNDIGKFIEVIYIGEDQSRQMSEGRNRPKLFEVAVDEDDTINTGAPPHDGAPAISDEDIPF